MGGYVYSTLGDFKKHVILNVWYRSSVIHCTLPYGFFPAEQCSLHRSGLGTRICTKCISGNAHHYTRTTVVYRTNHYHICGLDHLYITAPTSKQNESTPNGIADPSRPYSNTFRTNFTSSQSSNHASPTMSTYFADLQPLQLLHPPPPAVRKTTADKESYCINNHMSIDTSDSIDPPTRISVHSFKQLVRSVSRPLHPSDIRSFS